MVPLGGQGRYEDLTVPPDTEAELGRVVLHIRNNNTTSGLTGYMRALALTVDYLQDHLRELFDRCLLSGGLSECWNEGKLVILLKPGWPSELFAAYLPIMLVNFGVEIAGETSHNPHRSASQYGWTRYVGRPIQFSSREFDHRCSVMPEGHGTGARRQKWDAVSGTYYNKHDVVYRRYQRTVL